MSSTITLEKIVALCKRRGFVFSSAEIYSGINGVYDFGPLGAQMKRLLKTAWLKHMQSFSEDVLEMDGALLGPAATWKASGHLDNFSDPMIDCTSCKKRFRADDGSVDPQKPCPSCGNKAWTDVRRFNLMFETNLGALVDADAKAYLRPETAQSIFINFKNILSSCRVKVPFGIAQIGKAFRNEITPRQFVFRVREFEQMEMEFFCKPEQSDEYFTIWLDRQKSFYLSLGFAPESFRFRPHDADELAHYSKNCTDVEFHFPMGWKELEGIAHRGAFDLTQHSQHSGKDLSVFEQENNRSYMPHVVECSVGVDRLFLAVLCNAYYEDIVEGEARVLLKLPMSLAPIQVAVLSLVKKLNDATHPVVALLKAAGLRVQFDDSGSIGKRYRRYDEIGTPYCVTVDFNTLEDKCVTIRNRDTLEQTRVPLTEIVRVLTA
ncbi:MAG: glycyl-tRNA synthetase [Candidatus Dependentiae bacterium]|nr:glycyl-tRNA synthetase [Candidatus Dependentiae bacterium]